MEVHTHSHTERKKFTHYLWEFLMLFLAVFCGFLAENWREHMVEHQREKKYSVQLLNDLKEDTAIYHHLMVNVGEKLNKFRSDSLLLYHSSHLVDSDFVKHVKDHWAAYDLSVNTTTFNQMKSSGSLRYIKNDELTAALSAYYDRRIPVIQKYFDYVNDKLHRLIEPFFAEHFNLYKNFLLGDHYQPALEKYFERTERSDQLICNELGLYYLGINTLNVSLQKLNENAVDLLKILQKEYHLK